MAPKDMSVSWALALVDVTLLGKKGSLQIWLRILRWELILDYLGEPECNLIYPSVGGRKKEIR